MDKSNIPPLPTKTTGNPYKNAFHHFHNSNIQQNKLNNSLSLTGGNSLFTKQTVPQVNTGMPPSMIDANNQAIHNSGSLLQIKANSTYDSCLTNPNCGVNNLTNSTNTTNNQKGGKKRKTLKQKKQSRKNSRNFLRKKTKKNKRNLVKRNLVKKRRSLRKNSRNFLKKKTNKNKYYKKK